jgi:hypothetical protein
MKDDAPGQVPDTAAGKAADTRLWIDRFLRVESPWPWRAWWCFCCALVFCTMQAVPSWTHPDLRLGWSPTICYWVIGIAGAATGLVVARYRFPGMVAGALAGIGSVLAGVILLERINSYSRIVLVMVGMIGLLPGVAVYCVLHVLIDNAKAKPPEEGSPL